MVVIAMAAGGVRRIRWAAGSRLTLESNYNDRRRKPSLERDSFPGRAGRRVTQRYAHDTFHPILTWK